MDKDMRKIMLCNCQGTMAPDTKTIARGLDVKEPFIHSELCRAQLESFEKAASGDQPLLVCCTQEAPLFSEELTEDHDVRFVNIREKAGWSGDGKKASPKMAALLAEASLDIKPTRLVQMTSEGVLLIIGRGDDAIDAARQIAGRMNVTVILDGATDVQAPRLMDFPIFSGSVKSAKGHMGDFEVTVTDFVSSSPSSQANLVFADQGKRGLSHADLILDLRGDTPLFPAPEKRDGYYNPDPANPALVQKALFELSDMVGTFEKPVYVDYEAGICAHSRNQVDACSRCVDICPTGAVQPAGDHVAFDPYICAGCGSCAAVCPTGAAAYALPTGSDIFNRLRVMISTYQKAGGKNPALFVHDGDYGEEMINILARHGNGLPANVIPFAVNQVTQAGLDFLLAAVAYGVTGVQIMVPPAKIDEAAGLRDQMSLASEILAGLGYGDGHFNLIESPDPTEVELTLYSATAAKTPTAGAFLGMGRKRSLMSVVLKHLHEHAPKPVDLLNLNEGAPFGTVVVNTDRCTLCLSCAGTCPAGALKDNPASPQLRFIEENCVQCGLCAKTCPEKVIALVPRLNFTDDARRAITIKEEPPFECIACGKPFAAKSSIDHMMEKLKGHSMFSTPEALNRLKMCEDCRVRDMMTEDQQPMAYGEMPKVRTTDDYLAERAEREARKGNGKDHEA